MRRARFASDLVGQIYREGIRQNWKPEEGRNSGHYYLYCPHPKCHFRKTFSLTENGSSHKAKNSIAEMRRHGFVWQGRGGQHVAEFLGSD